MARELSTPVVSQITSGSLRPAFFFEGIFSSGAIRAWTGSRDITLENQFQYSGFSSNIWTEVRSNVTLGAATGPFGGEDAAALIEDTTASNDHYINYNNPATSTTSGTEYRFSVFVKKNGRDWVRLHMGSPGFPASPYVFFNVNTGTVGTIAAGVDSATIEDFGNGWYLCSAISVSDATVTNNNPVIYIATADGTTSYTGGGTNGLYVYGANFNTTTSDPVYVETDSEAIDSPLLFLGNGALQSITPPSESGGIQPPGMSVVLDGVSPSHRSIVLNNSNNYAEGNLWFAVMDDNWLPYNNMYKLFTGYLNGAQITESGKNTTINLPYESKLAGFRRRKELRYTDANQQLRYEGDLGLQYVIQTQQWTGYWGKDNDRTLANFRSRRDTR